MCTFAFVALAYACSVAGILLGWLINQPRVRPPRPSHGARVVPLPPMPAGVVEDGARYAAAGRRRRAWPLGRARVSWHLIDPHMVFSIVGTWQ
jgi:hypothetical protein